MTINSIAYDSLSVSMLKLSTGQRINSSADNSASLAISKNIESIARGLDQGSRNVYDTKDLLSTTDGALQNMTDGLQRVRELTVKASNGTYTDSDRKLMQIEADELLKGIQASAESTQFNTLKPLDGSLASLHVASNPNGSGMKIALQNATLENLGIQNFDLTSGKSNISAIDDAIERISTSRAELGASSNRLDRTAAYNYNASLNEQAARSRIMDTDYALESSNFNRENAIRQYSIQLQKNNIQEKLGYLNLF